MFFSEKKIQKMSSSGRVKNAVLIIQEVRQQILCGKSIDSSYLKKFLDLIVKDINADKKELFFSFLSKIPKTLTSENLRGLSNLRYVLLSNIGKEPAEWCCSMDECTRFSTRVHSSSFHRGNCQASTPRGDMDVALAGGLQGCPVRYVPGNYTEDYSIYDSPDGETGQERDSAADECTLSSPDWTIRQEREILPINVFLDDLRSPFNVGSIIRTAESFCYENIFLSPHTPSPEHKRAERSAMGTAKLVKWSRGSAKDLPLPVFALETGGTPVSEFAFPESGTVILGSEEDGISSDAMDIARKSLGVVSIPLYGIKGSLNVGVAFGILSFYWVNKLKAGKAGEKS